ncbi:hypothetical protein WJ96_15920 [Burkholderia ubonensis]|uniref:[acyl-carrier-protein] S-malonyltransferase n=1 Tax=Burkholderia ubonensis TaxID=101571 RepID=A0AAW3MSQ8_9BURK|nr:acyltransferase domain-containing protein [Burkholderia ubonensis]KVN68788.1 hypothetical protein WJ67_28030 [Burkholderia ubonensis]KVP92693.1 hypothetical protein WJ96_15920 [Burkholderia ubonensis]KWD53281.1 hypothetical protein WL67_16640 [Burkholderia ubonensis]KWD65404.1 hypothetical protein WL66_28245 [Burkholderia ubonensis]
MTKSIFLFPGQGGFYSGVLTRLVERYPQVEYGLGAIEAVARDRFGGSLVERLRRCDGDLDAWLCDSPDYLQLGIYAASVGVFEALRARGVAPDAVVGHSFGEIAALACAGAFSVDTGARIVCDRVRALNQAAPRDGAMAAIGAQPTVVLQLIEHSKSVGGADGLHIAVENCASQTVVSGRRAALECLIETCGERGVSAQLLKSPYGFHHPNLAEAGQKFAEALSGYRFDTLRIPAYSPILGRYYTPADDIGACLAAHLTLPVRFSRAIDSLRAQGFDLYVECGALGALAKLVMRILRPNSVKTLLGASSVADELDVVDRIVHYFKRNQLMKDDSRSSDDALDFDTFWKRRGPFVVEWIKAELLNEFNVTREGRDASAMAPVASMPGAALESAIVQPALSAEPSPAAHSVSPEAPSAHVPRDRLFSELVQIYADAMEYPVEVFTEEVELEAELGIDSVKQTEIIQRIIARYGLPPLPANFRNNDFKAMGQIVDFVHRNQNTGRS